MKSIKNPTLTASKIALIYALISVAWILFSDQLLAATMTTVETEIRPDLPIVLCTGFGDQVNEEMIKSIGIRALLLNPLTIHELAHSVRMAIEVNQ